MSDDLAVKVEQEFQTTYLTPLKNNTARINACHNLSEAQPIISQSEELIRLSKLFFKRFEPQTRHLEKSKKDNYKMVEQRLNREWNNAQRSFEGLKKSKPELFGSMNEAKRAEYIDQRSRLLQGREIQTSTAESLRRTQRSVHDSIEVGNDTTQLLEKQTEQMTGMVTTLHDTDNMLDKSKRVLYRMNNRLVTNKIMTTVIIIFQILLFILICYFKFYN